MRRRTEKHVEKAGRSFTWARDLFPTAHILASLRWRRFPEKFPNRPL